MNYIVKRITKNDLYEIEECDKLLQCLIKEDSKYDLNYNTNVKLNSLSYDIEDKNNYIYVSIHENEVVGFIYGKINNKKTDKEKTAKILFIYVKEKYRNQGIGTMLINKLTEQLKYDGICYIDIQVYCNNKDAINLYNKLGFYNYTLNIRKKI